ncbi:MAG: efflux RND transporter periplasmic adaptor subunit [Betaproteobacteria bacterium]
MRNAIVTTAVLLFAAGCGKTADQTGTQAAPAPSVLVTATPVRYAPIQKTLTAYGTVEYSPEGAHILSVQSEEVVAQLLVAVGQTVSKGERLLTLEPSANGRLEFDKARIEVEFAQKEVQRLTDLRTRQLATNAEVQAAEKNLATVKAALANIIKRHGGSGPRVIRADVAGTVQAVNVQLGQVVAAGAPLATIGDRNHSRVRLGVEQDDLPKLHVGQRVAVRPLNSPDTPIASSIAKIFANIDPKTHLAEAVIPLRPTHGLLPGAAVRAEIVLEENPHALVVPRSAVLYRPGKPYVFLDDHGHAVERQVETGIDNGQLIEISKGLVAGESVVTVGNAELSDGMAVRTEAPQ